MPAIGQDTGTIYQEQDILDFAVHQTMSREPLYRIDQHDQETDTLVVPVRNKHSPNFRKIKGSQFTLQHERRESDPTHDACIATLVRHLSNSKLKIWSPVFDEDGKPAKFGQAIFSQGKNHYQWWQDGGPCRMASGEEGYIQPDICGRSKDVFFPSARQQNVVIEVINTHPPEIDTFYTLLNYSKFNHLVLFYYVAEGSDRSQYSRYELQDGTLSLRVAHYLIGGRVFRNGDEIQRWGKTDEAWFDHLRSTYFGTPIRDKRP